MRGYLRTGAIALSLIGGLVVLGVVGSMIPRIISPDHTHGMGHFIDRIWWPASIGRLTVYALLAFLVFPLQVRRRVQFVLAKLNAIALAEGSHTELPIWQARLQHLQRVGHRTHWVFLALVVRDLVITQFPYFLLRG